MRYLKKIFLVLGIQSLLALTMNAQEPDSLDTGFGDAASLFPPMNVLIDSAIKHNALVRFRQQEISAKQYNLKSQQSSWSRNVGLQADTRYGTFDNFSTNTSEGQNPSILSTSTSQFNYGVGAYVKVPLYDLFNHKNQVNQAKAELGQAQSMAEAQRDEVTQMVIRQYNDLMLKQRLLRIKSQNLESSKINMEMGERQFRTGVINIEEYVRITDIASKAESDYEGARTDFITAYMLLEELTGVKSKLTTGK
jgi:outer membrane protein TolC